jgi:glycosyltransferase involved in cell wall biosynthesis
MWSLPSLRILDFKQVLIVSEAKLGTHTISFEKVIGRTSLFKNYQFHARFENVPSSLEPNALLSQIKPEIIIFSRSSTPESFALLREAKAQGVRTIYHVDDLLIELPSDLKLILGHHSAESTIQRRLLFLREVDTIYASTAPLAHKLSEIIGRSVSYGHVYAAFTPESVPEKVAGRFLVGYTGSRSHQRDFDLVVLAVEALLERQPNSEFELFGGMTLPESWSRFEGRVRHIKGTPNYDRYRQMLKARKWNLGLAPLVDDDFNKCKAPTKWIEYTSAGIPILASDVGPYQQINKGLGWLTSNEDWVESLLCCFNESTAFANEKLQASRLHCATNFALPNLKHQLQDVLQNALASDYIGVCHV